MIEFLQTLIGDFELAVFVLNFLEEANIFDRDHSLIGESFEQRDLPVRKRPDFHPADHDHSYGITFSQQRSRKNRPCTMFS